MRSVRWLQAMVGICVVVAAVAAAIATAQEFPLPEAVQDRIDDFSIALPDEDGEPTTWTLDEYIETPRCLMHPLLVAEQGYFYGDSDYYKSGTDYLKSGTDYYKSGTVGGVTFGGENAPPSSEIGSVWDALPPGATTPSGTPLPPLGELLNLQPTPEKDVVILVADDFGDDTYKLPGSAFVLQDSQQGEFQGLVDSETITHGALVMHFLNALIASTKLYRLDTDQSTESWVVWERLSEPSARLIVVAHNLNDPTQPGLTNTRQIKSGLQNGIERVVGALSSERLSGIVVNMSWVLLPCPTVESFIQHKSDFPTFEDYVAGLLALVENDPLRLSEISVEDVVQILTWVGSNDPLWELVAAPERHAPAMAGDQRLAFVAASGNFRLPYQMMPAAWPDVVGVGAPNDNNPPPPFSNVGEVIAPGAWFRVAPVMPWELDALDDSEPNGTMALAGTSYSSPIVALFTAVDAASASRCTPSLSRGGEPGLASFPAASKWLVDAAYGQGNGCQY